MKTEPTTLEISVGILRIRVRLGACRDLFQVVKEGSAGVAKVALNFSNLREKLLYTGLICCAVTEKWCEVFVPVAHLRCFCQLPLPVLVEHGNASLDHRLGLCIAAFPCPIDANLDNTS